MKSSSNVPSYLLGAALLLAASGWAHASDLARVHAVYFSSPQCPFCALVSERDLAPLMEQHGDSLAISIVDTSTDDGRATLHALWEERQLAVNRRGVPTLVVGDELLVGASEVSARLPALIEAGLSRGGVSPPPIAGLPAVAGDFDPAPEAAITWRERVHHDVPGNYVALALLAVLLLLGLAMLPRRRWQERLSIMTPLGIKIGVAALGLGVALYLAWGETTQQELICGPIGQCNIVQNSDLAMLWGFFPLAVLGALGYATILAVYLFGRFGPAPLAQWTPAVLLVLSGGGFLFSILLTFWQPFVIGATCAWCLISAVTMTLTFLLGLGVGRRQLRLLLRGPDAVS